MRLPVDLRDVEVRLHGVIGLPELARPTAKYQYLYLNGRPIRDKFIQHALREAYRGLTEPGRHPAAILLLDLPPQDVDVNVHPTKAEVRFRDSGRVHGLVMAAVREKLLGSDLAPQVIAKSDAVDEVERGDLRTKLAEFFKVAPTQGTLPLPAHADVTRATAPSIPATPAPSPSPEPSPSPARNLDMVSAWLASSRNDTASGEEASSVASVPATSENPDVQVASVAPRANRDPSTSLPAIQLHNSYLVAQSDDGMIIIDQHALHERIMYEELSSRIMRGPLESQRLLIPETIPASSRQVALLEQIQPLLARLGIEVSPFGPNTVAVQAFPSFLSKLEPGQFVAELLERGEQELLDLHEEELLHEILDMMSCKAAVKAGDPLTPAEIEALLSRRELIDRSSNCPHGRPTTLRLSLRDLEKQFKRTGF
jgi:DNA mismatch repair protein MutL